MAETRLQSQPPFFGGGQGSHVPPPRYKGFGCVFMYWTAPPPLWAREALLWLVSSRTCVHVVVAPDPFDQPVNDLDTLLHRSATLRPPLHPGHLQPPPVYPVAPHLAPLDHFPPVKSHRVIRLGPQQCFPLFLRRPTARRANVRNAGRGGCKPSRSRV